MKLSLILILITFFVFPVFSYAFPNNGLILGNALTFATLTIDINGNMGGNSYGPDTSVIGVGQGVVWRNLGIFTHTATSGTGSTSGIFDTGFLSSGSSSSTMTFNSATATPYYCQVHGSIMYGFLVVTTVNIADWQKFANDILSLPENQIKPAAMMHHSHPMTMSLDSNSKESEEKSSKLQSGGTVEMHASIIK